MLFRMEERSKGSAIPYRPRGLGSPNSRFWDEDLNPCQKPPWGFLTAINLDTGEFRWRSVLGVADALLEKGLSPTGSPNIGGSLTTAGGGNKYSSDFSDSLVAYALPNSTARPLSATPAR